ncbi:MAG TPA: hypothetical protein VFI73_10615 [Candidatus Nitrosopolaris sp.]|nr:hypothetical protein [Candidatus Nitrosopolaris sp.]
MACYGEEEQKEEGLQQGAETTAEEKREGVEAIRSTAEEEQETIAKEKVKQPKKKKAPKSERKEAEFGITAITKEVKKQTSYLARLEGRSLHTTKILISRCGRFDIGE